MKVKIIKRCTLLDLDAGIEINTDDGAITVLQAFWMCNKNYATLDMNADDIRGLAHEDRIYKVKAVISKNGNIYQLKNGVESSATFIITEWNLLVEGVAQ